MIRDKSPGYQKENAKTDRKSLIDTELSKFSSSPYLKKDVHIGGLKKDEGALHRKLCKNLGHMRSVSDQKLMSHKRATSRD